MTVAWWNDLWLNEGFAVYIQYKGMKAAEPTWDTDAKFLSDDLHGVLNFDATFASHPIVVDVNTPDQVWSLTQLFFVSFLQSSINVKKRSLKV